LALLDSCKTQARRKHIGSEDWNAEGIFGIVFYTRNCSGHVFTGFFTSVVTGNGEGKLAIILDAILNDNFNDKS
jgi:hypothetical protein